MDKTMFSEAMIKSLAAAGLLLLAPACSVYPQPAYVSGSMEVQAVIVPEPPPPPLTVVVVETPTPGPDYLWMSGYWDWSGYQYAWVEAHWEPPHYGYYWSPPSHVNVSGSVNYTPGHWKQSPGGKSKGYSGGKAYHKGKPVNPGYGTAYHPKGSNTTSPPQKYKNAPGEPQKYKNAPGEPKKYKKQGKPTKYKKVKGKPSKYEKVQGKPTKQ